MRLISYKTYNKLHCKDMPENIFSVGRESFKRAFQFFCFGAYFCCSFSRVPRDSTRAVGINSSEAAASLLCLAIDLNAEF